LCLVLAALVLIWSGALSRELWPVLSLLAAFGAAIVVFRARHFLPGRTLPKLLIESWSMLIFITGVLWFTGKGASPLLNLYLLPIILSALTLGRLVTLLQVAVIAVCHFLLAAATPGVDVISLLYASQVVGQIAPFLLVAMPSLLASLRAPVVAPPSALGGIDPGRGLVRGGPRRGGRIRRSSRGRA
jgi:hypothetical protein